MKCLVLMPFAREFESVFATVRAAVSDALPDEKIDCYWLKDELSAGRITDDIVHGIQHSAFCIADVSGNNPNVMWETGYAMALGKPAILIGQSVETLPFDLKVHRVLPYRTDQMDKLAASLATSVRQTLARYAVQPSPERTVRAMSRSMAIAVTGSMAADPAKANERVRTILHPYLSLDVTWYCGGRGATDELVLSYLASCGKDAIAVGYDRYDFSPGVRKLVEDRKIGVLDASVQKLPKDFKGPSERDILFASKADLVILFWASGSSGTRRLIDYFNEKEISTLVAYI